MKKPVSNFLSTTVSSCIEKQLIPILILTLTALTLFSCGPDQKYSFELSDFKPSLQPHLVKIIRAGELSGNQDSLPRIFLRDSCSKDELLKLLKFENPLVRVMAYRAIVNRNESDYFSILLNNLDDTTKVRWWVFDDVAGDFMVSDMMIKKVVYERKLSPSQKDSLVDEVLMKHSYLGTAEWMIQEIHPKNITRSSNAWHKKNEAVAMI